MGLGMNSLPVEHHKRKDAQIKAALHMSIIHHFASDQRSLRAVELFQGVFPWHLI
jgi:hypothetical protein